MFRRRFAEVISRQLDLFEEENADYIRDCDEAEKAYGRAARDESEELYGDYMELLEAGTEVLAEMRDRFAATLDKDATGEYEQAFNRAIAKRFPRFAVQIGDV